MPTEIPQESGESVSITSGTISLLDFLPQPSEGSNDLCTKAHDVEIYRNKRKKGAKESTGKVGRFLSVVIALL